MAGKRRLTKEQVEDNRKLHDKRVQAVYRWDGLRNKDMRRHEDRYSSDTVAMDDRGILRGHWGIGEGCRWRRAFTNH